MNFWDEHNSRTNTIDFFKKYQFLSWKKINFTLDTINVIYIRIYINNRMYFFFTISFNIAPRWWNIFITWTFIIICISKHGIVKTYTCATFWWFPICIKSRIFSKKIQQNSCDKHQNIKDHWISKFKIYQLIGIFVFLNYFFGKTIFPKNNYKKKLSPKSDQTLQ